LDDYVPLNDSAFNAEKFGDEELEIDFSKSQKFDSAHYYILRVFNPKGQLLYEDIENKLSKEQYEKAYEPNGKLYSEGATDVKGKFHVGVWRYYYPDGRIKELNFDTALQISFYRAFQIAKKHCSEKGRLEITEELFEDRYYWHVINWTDADEFQGTGEYFRIRRSNGDVVIPKDNGIFRMQ
jgi:antitoxin component YwqK of YwqJK toxin-antitoxin module